MKPATKRYPLEPKTQRVFVLIDENTCAITGIWLNYETAEDWREKLQAAYPDNYYTLKCQDIEDWAVHLHAHVDCQHTVAFNHQCWRQE